MTSCRKNGAANAGAASELDDAQIFHVLDTANLGEVEQGQVATTRAQDDDVRGFAQMMVQAHTMTKAQVDMVAAQTGMTPAPNAVSTMLDLQSDTIVANLQAASADNFDRMYMQSQVDVHSQVLMLLSDQLIPAADNAELEAVLTMMRMHAQEHLQMAQMIQGALEPDR